MYSPLGTFLLKTMVDDSSKQKIWEDYNFERNENKLSFYLYKHFLIQILLGRKKTEFVKHKDSRWMFRHEWGASRGGPILLATAAKAPASFSLLLHKFTGTHR